MPTNNGGIFPIPPQQCISCNGVSGGWNTVEPTTKANCESIGGISSVPAESPSETLGACGNVLTGSCETYFSTRFVNGVPVSVSTPWVGLGGSGNVYVNACNISQLGVPSQYNPNEILPTENVSIDSSSLPNLISSCLSFASLHPELNICVTGVQQYAPITINNTSIISSTPSTTDPVSIGWGWAAPLTLIGLTSLATLYSIISSNTPPPPPVAPITTVNPIPEGLDLKAAAAAALKAILGVRNVILFGPVLVQPPSPLGGGDTASTSSQTFMALVYNDDYSQASVLNIQLPTV